MIQQKLNDLTEVEFNNPVSMDYANDAVYVANPAPSYGLDGGIYKVSLKDYSRKLIAKLSHVQAVAVSKSGDLYFSEYSDPGYFYKVESRYLNENQPLTSATVWKVAESIEPFSTKQSSKGMINIMGLDFDNQGRLYISANQTTGFGEHAIITRSTDDTLSSFQTFGEDEDVNRRNQLKIEDIEIGPSGNLYANFAGNNYNQTYKIPASVLQQDQPVLTTAILGEGVGDSNKYRGITFLPTGVGYATMIDSQKGSIHKLSFYDQAPVSPGAEDPYQLENLNIQTPYGMAYYQDNAYVAQGNNGLSKVSLSTRTVTQLVYGSNSLNLRAVTVDSKGGVYYAVPNAKNPGYTYIKKVDASSLNQPLTAEQLLAKSINYAYIQENHISGLTMDKNNQLYISLDKQQEPGLLRWNSTSKTLTPVLKEASMITAITFDNQGNLYFKSSNPQSKHPYASIVKINADDLKATLPVNDDKLLSYKQNLSQTQSYNGLLFLPNGTSYFSNGTILKRIYPESRPIVTLKGESDTVFQGDLYHDPGISMIEDQQYSKFDIKVTYSFNGNPVSQVDTSIPGLYTIHYVAVNPAGIASLEKNRDVNVKPTPGQLTDWYIPGIETMDADSQNLYFFNRSYENNPNHGLYKISLETMQKTKLAAIDDISAVAVNTSGDLFFARYPMDNMIFKIEAKHLQSGTPLTASQLMRLSRTYMPFTAKEASKTPHKIIGLEFDNQGGLYAAVNIYGNQNLPSKIVRLTGKDWNQSTLITELPRTMLSASSIDIDMSPAGDLYISTSEEYIVLNYATYKLTAEQLTALPIPTNSMQKVSNNGGGIAFLTDGTGYRSNPRGYDDNRTQTIFRLDY